MRAAVATAQYADTPLRGLALREWPDPEPAPGWTRVELRAASLNPHDLWTLRGVGHPAERIPIVLGCDGAGVTEDGREVVIHPVLGDANRGGGDLTLDPQRALMSETLDGTLAEHVLVPDQMLVDKPAALSFAEAACLGVAWGTAYRMLFTRAGVRAGSRVLVQGGNGGVASAAIALAASSGARVYATARTEEKRRFARACGATAVFDSGARLPERVDVVVETIGAATWSHSLKSLRPGGTVVIAGATSGTAPDADLARIFYQQLRVVGSTGCTLSEFEALLRTVEASGVRPQLETIGFDDIPAGFARMLSGEVLGKLVVEF
ncbi:zinc-binding dehydrogenase [Leucobacter weissii]|uniref:Zinc-binding dehydrogenase n=1 Tax=Leucobacter weissii TaxID=1983706 RepID=A0A939S8Z7_9MICO|nr:zinc-binding dehydrogenase [Leucobacter weissii]MBO1900402.1 zinc-binding dehydrogenase [Leucobacter weissii]